jgi:hypothetical protein
MINAEPAKGKNYRKLREINSELNKKIFFRCLIEVLGGETRPSLPAGFWWLIILKTIGYADFTFLNKVDWGARCDNI